MDQLAILTSEEQLPPAADLADLADRFCRLAPHRALPYSKRNWGGPLHSLCSYQGKLKPSIAHFLVSWFTRPGQTVLDPLCGVGTIPLEARRLGRVGIGNDLSPLAACVSRAKLEPFAASDIEDQLSHLEKAIENGPSLERLAREVDVEFGLNCRIVDYFHPRTLREVLIARSFVSEPTRGKDGAARDVVKASLAHILHGNRPYALSRRSHPVTPFAPTGPAEYRSLIWRLKERLRRVVPDLLRLHDQPSGRAYGVDFRELRLEGVDAVITSPPFAGSLRFWSMNWMRLWFMGWEPADFAVEPARYLETQQRASFDPYRELAQTLSAQMRSEALLILHLGETSSINMAGAIVPLLTPWFEVIHVGREDVDGTESHGLNDKGSTRAHWYVFAVRGG